LITGISKLEFNFL